MLITLLIIGITPIRPFRGIVSRVTSPVLSGQYHEPPSIRLVKVTHRETLLWRMSIYPLRDPIRVPNSLRTCRATSSAGPAPAVDIANSDRTACSRPSFPCLLAW